MKRKLKITREYRFKAVIEFKGTYYTVKETMQLNNLKLSPSSRENEIIISFSIEANNAEEAENEADSFIESLTLALLLVYNTATRIKSLELTETSNKTEKLQEKTLIERINNCVAIKQYLDKNSIINIVNIAKNIESFDEELLRILKWYKQALLENDLTDKFIKFWIAFEIWAYYKGYKKGAGSESAKLANALVNECRFDKDEADKIYEARSALFHAGVNNKIEKKKHLQKLENCLKNIIMNLKIIQKSIKE